MESCRLPDGSVNSLFRPAIIACSGKLFTLARITNGQPNVADDLALAGAVAAGVEPPEVRWGLPVTFCAVFYLVMRPLPSSTV